MTGPAPVLMQIGAAEVDGQRIAGESLVATPEVSHAVPGHDGIGQRLWLEPETQFTVSYAATVAVDRTPAPLAALTADSLTALPGEVLEYLFPSRYCPVDTMHAAAVDMFGHLTGGAAVEAVRGWITTHLAYVPGASHGGTTALDTFHAREGVCRDYAHLLIALVRSLGIPARMVSAYSPDVDPQDFHALAQVWLAGDWHLVDATGMADPATTAIIGVGRDAADIAFLTIFGAATLNAQVVEVALVG
ncbi:MAG: transglutaminase-like domain-containing protein [Novosphingobium sp.]